jgi:DNA mismatch repair protein MutS2
MQAAVLRALEFGRVREALARAALTVLGRDRAHALDPETETARVGAALDLTLDAVAFTRDGGSLAISAPEDLDVTLGALSVAGEPLDPLRLLALARFLASVTAVVDAIERARPSQRLVALSAVAQPAAAFDAEIAAVRKAIEPSGDVSDHASPSLHEIRTALRRQRARLRSTLVALMQARETSN